METRYFHWHYRDSYSRNSLRRAMKMDKQKERSLIKVYVRARPFNVEEKEREERSAIHTFKDESRIKVFDERHSMETSYFFDGIFCQQDSNKHVYEVAGKPLIDDLLSGINCALLTYGQTGTGKTHTLMAEDSVTIFIINDIFKKIESDCLHQYSVSCSFVQVYQDKVYDLLKSDSRGELPVREHPKKGIYVAHLTQHQVKTAKETIQLLSEGRKELIIAETRMVRQSSRSHAIFQITIERRLKVEQEHNTQQRDIKLGHVSYSSEDNLIVRGKMDICDLAGSERLGKTKADGIRLSEAKYINSSLLELGNVIHALSEGTRRHIPFRNSTLTRLLQECLGPKCRTNFIVCVAPSASEAYETRCSLNFGTRARKITNKERITSNVEIDYKILASRLARRIEDLENQLEKIAGGPEALLVANRYRCTRKQDREMDTSRDNGNVFGVWDIELAANVAHSVLVMQFLGKTAEIYESSGNREIIFKNTVVEVQKFISESRDASAKSEASVFVKEHFKAELLGLYDNALRKLQMIQGGHDSKHGSNSKKDSQYTKFNLPTEYMVTLVKDACHQIQDILIRATQINGEIGSKEALYEITVEEHLKNFVGFMRNNAAVTDLPQQAYQTRIGMITHMLWTYKALLVLLIVIQTCRAVLDFDKNGQRCDNGDNNGSGGTRRALLHSEEQDDDTGLHNDQYTSCSTEPLTDVEIDKKGHRNKVKTDISSLTLETTETTATNHVEQWSDVTSSKYEDYDRSTTIDSEIKSRTFESFQLASSPIHEVDDVQSGFTCLGEPGKPSPINDRKMRKNLEGIEHNTVSEKLMSKLSDLTETSEIDQKRYYKTFSVSWGATKNRKTLRQHCDTEGDLSQEDLNYSNFAMSKSGVLPDLTGSSTNTNKRIESLETSNTKLLRTLNIVIKENKDINEKLRVIQREKMNILNELDATEKKLAASITEKSQMGSEISRLLRDNSKLESSNKKLSNSNYCLQVKIKEHEHELKAKEKTLLDSQDLVLKEQTEKRAIAAQLQALHSDVIEKEKALELLQLTAKEESKKREGLISALKKTCCDLEITKSTNIYNAGPVTKVTKRREKCVVSADITVETELFMAIENNIKMESALTDIKSKLSELSSTSYDDSCHQISENGDENKKNVCFTATTIQTGNSSSSRKAKLSRSKSLNTERENINPRRDASAKISRDKASELPKTTRIKEILKEKQELEAKNANLQQSVSNLERELTAAKNHISVLVTECGNLDREVVSLRNRETSSFKDENFSFEFHHQPTMEETYNADLNFERIKDEGKQREKYEDQKRKLEAMDTKFQQAGVQIKILSKENLCLKQKLRHANEKLQQVTIEMRYLQSQVYERNLENSELQDCISHLNLELHNEKTKATDNQAKINVVKRKYENKIKRLKEIATLNAKRLDLSKRKHIGTDNSHTPANELQNSSSTNDGDYQRSSNETDSGLAHDVSDYFDIC